MRPCILLALSIVLSACRFSATAYAQQPAANRPQLVVLSGHEGPVHGVAMSPDGKWLLSGGDDGTARLWDVATGREVRVLRRLETIVPSPAMIKMFGKSVRSVRGSQAAVQSVAFSSDGKRAATGSDDSLHVWDLATGKELHSFRPESDAISDVNGTTSVSFSKDGKRLVAVNGGAWVWDIADGKATGPFGGEVRCAVLSADGKRLIWGDLRDVMIIDPAANKLIRKLDGHGGQVTCLALSADEKWLFTGSDDSTIRQWDLATGKTVRTLQGHEKGIVSLALSGDGKSLISTGQDNTIRVWDWADGKAVRVFGDFRRELSCSALSADGKWLVTVEGDKRQPGPRGLYGPEKDPTIRLWDVAAGKEVGVFQQPKNLLRAMTLSFDGKLLAAGSGDDTARVWDLTTGKQIGVFPGHDRGVDALFFGGDGKWLATLKKDEVYQGDGKGKARVWEIASGKVVRELIGVQTLAFAGNGSWLAYGIGGSGGKAGGGFRKGKAFPGGKKGNGFPGKNGVAFQVGDVIPNEKNVHAFDLTGTGTTSLSELPWPYQIALSANGKSLATAGSSYPEHEIHLWNPQKGGQVATLSNLPCGLAKEDAQRKIIPTIGQGICGRLDPGGLFDGPHLPGVHDASHDRRSGGADGSSRWCCSCETSVQVMLTRMELSSRSD